MSEADLQALAARLAGTEPNLLEIINERSFTAASGPGQLLDDANERVRANAYALLSLVDPLAFTESLPKAVADESRIVRMQAALCLRNVPPADLRSAADAAVSLLNDPDPGVRKFALKGAGPANMPDIAAAVDRIRTQDPEPHLRELAADIHANR